MKMALPSLPRGNQEFYDGSNWFPLATQNYVLNNNLKAVAAGNVATTLPLAASYLPGVAGVGATLTFNGTTLVPPQARAALVIDGVTVTLNQRILVKDQSDATQNGIYTVSNTGSTTTDWILTRATDFDSVAQLMPGITVNIISGATQAVSSWMLTSSVTTIGTSNITFVEMAQTGGVQRVNGYTDEITVTTTNNIATVRLASNPVISGTGAVTIPVGTTANRPTTLKTGMLRFNTDIT